MRYPIITVKHDGSARTGSFNSYLEVLPRPIIAARPRQGFEAEIWRPPT
jgi:hypothetical protein